MRAQFPPEITEKILATAKAESCFIEEVKLGRRLFTMRHCGTREVQVKTYQKINYDMPFSDINRQNGYDVTVCPVCLRARHLIPSGD